DAWGVSSYYFFDKNLQGDIVAIYNESGVKIGSYTYDAWGNFTVAQTAGISELDALVLNTYNPFRYRGYFYDVETGLYYLQSRYYNPQWGRFINVDGVMAGVGGSIQGYNLFTYCFNNPINMVDALGDWPKWIENTVNWVNNNVVAPVGNFINGVKEDIANFNKDNSEIQKVLDANYFSSYNGTLVLKLPFMDSNAFSFGVIVTGSDLDETTLRHEYGHKVQLGIMGWKDYIGQVAIPSLTINILDRMGNLPYNYYTYPWEATADNFGGVKNRRYYAPPLPAGESPSYFDLFKLFFD
ncbi:MAG: RHS repeat-associated core domain-containing protein, partial [Akkermansia sp.]|nr:RHS repeat-associated core domain-containing protein [Akkermansia sp.]